MSPTRHIRAAVTLSDPWPDGSGTRGSLAGPTARLRGLVVMMGLLAAFSAPTPAPAQVTEPERALLGRAPAGSAAGGPVETVAGPPVPDGEAALLNKRGGAIRLAGPSAPSAAEPLVDGARALLNGAPRSAHSRPAVTASSKSEDSGE